MDKINPISEELCTSTQQETKSDGAGIQPSHPQTNITNNSGGSSDWNRDASLWKQSDLALTKIALI